MKITRSRLRQIIKEEVSKTLVTEEAKLISHKSGKWDNLRVKGADGVEMTIPDYHSAIGLKDAPIGGMVLLHDFTLIVPDGVTVKSFNPDAVSDAGLRTSYDILPPGEYTTNDIP